MTMPAPKAPAVPEDQMDDMPGMPGMKLPAAKKTPVPPKKKSGEGDRQGPTTEAASDALYAGGAR
jgi:hypothetical protein